MKDKSFSGVTYVPLCRSNSLLPLVLTLSEFLVYPPLPPIPLVPPLGLESESA